MTVYTLATPQSHPVQFFLFKTPSYSWRPRSRLMALEIYEYPDRSVSGLKLNESCTARILFPVDLSSRKLKSVVNTYPILKVSKWSHVCHVCPSINMCTVNTIIVFLTRPRHQTRWEKSRSLGRFLQNNNWVSLEKHFKKTF